MNTTEQRQAAKSARPGPITAGGKAIASLNATKHGLLSGRLFVGDEDPQEFEVLLHRLSESLRPVGAIEETLVERVAITIWRQRRLVTAESARIGLARQLKPVATAVSAELGRGFLNEVKEDDLEPFDSVQEEWCSKAIEEIDNLGEPDLATLEQQAPLIYGQLLTDAEDETPATYLAEHEGGLAAYVAELLLWCRKQLREAEQRPQLLELAEQVRTKGLVLPADALMLMSRYQTTLDNQLYKALRALRETQAWRLKTLEAVTEPVAETAEAA